MNIPARKDLRKEDTWDLTELFADDAAWDTALASFNTMAENGPSYKGTLSQSLDNLAAFLDYYQGLGILEEQLGVYASLRTTEDEGDAAAKTLWGKYIMAASRTDASLSWVTPEIQAIPDEKIQSWLQDGRLKDYRIYIEKLLRFKPHILSEKEERLLALKAEAEGLADQTFSSLTNVDMKWGTIDTPQGPMPLSQGTWTLFMENPDRAIRKEAYTTFYKNFEEHQNTLASLYAGSVKQDVINARIRGYKTAREAALFPDKVDEAVYDNLVNTVNANLDKLHRYYELRRKTLKVDKLRHYDVYVNMVKDVKKHSTWDQAVDLIGNALGPLGDEYVSTIRAGLLGLPPMKRWCDRYENQGKRSGAFSQPCYTANPHILLSDKEDSIDSVFTLAHEGGHSMHTWYSVRNNPFMCYGYSIFEAEVASTFNEELLFQYLYKTADSEELKTYLLNRRVDDILATLYRQTMFAEYEAGAHCLEEGGTPLTPQLLRSEYRKLLEKYFGPAMVFEENSDMEGLRIPHFYTAFYVYKYSTGIAAAIALARRVLQGGKAERDDYFKFLKSGGSRYPLESLRLAGVDMSTPAPIQEACDYFDKLVGELGKRLA
jgi:oligoendopeptidase F